MSSSTDSVSTIQPTRVAIIGYGLAGSVFHAPLISSTPGMTIAAIVTSNPERQQQAYSDFPNAAILTSAGQLWRDPTLYDLVVVATPNRSHLPLGIAAMNAGLPVVIDKPITALVSSAEQLISTSERTGKLLTVFQNRRWDNDFLTVRRLLAADLDLLGTITRFESRFERYRATPRQGAWRELPGEEEAGGLLFDLGSHLVDQPVQLFGQPTQVYAEVEKKRPGALVDDDTFVALRFANGVYAHLWMSAVTRIAGPRIRISGLLGTYEKWGLDPQEEALRTGIRPGDPDWGLEPHEKWGRLSTDIGGIHIDGPVEMLPGAYEQYYALLREALVTGGPPPVDPKDAVMVLRIIEAAQQSARSGTVVGFE
jgi:scyllo-inositol 2-dehydrogenase (NADP+)